MNTSSIANAHVDQRNFVSLAERPVMITKEGQILLVFPKQGYWCVVDEKRLSDIRLLLKNNKMDTSKISKDWLTHLTEHKLLKELDDCKFPQRVNLSDEQVFEIAISLTNACNIVCKYCYREAAPNIPTEEDITFEEVLSLLEFFASKFYKSSKYVHFTGGELFLRKDIFSVIEAALQFNYTIRISTNGILLNSFSKEQMQRLSDPRIRIRVSIDGPDADTHGMYRPKNSFKPAVNGFRRIAKCNPKTGLKAVIHERNIRRLRGLLDLVLDSGANHFTYNILRNFGRAAKAQLPRIDEETVFRELLNIVEKDKKYIPILKGSPFGNVIMSTHTKNFIFVNYLGIYVDPRARIYPHGNLPFDEFLLWDLRQQNLELFDIDRLYEFRKAEKRRA